MLSHQPVSVSVAAHEDMARGVGRNCRSPCITVHVFKSVNGLPGTVAARIFPHYPVSAAPASGKKITV